MLLLTFRYTIIVFYTYYNYQDYDKMKKKIKTIFKLRDLEDRIVNLTAGWIATELKDHLERGDDSKTTIELSEDAHKDKLQQERFKLMPWFMVVNSFSDLQRFMFQVLSTFYTKEQFERDGEMGQLNDKKHSVMFSTTGVEK